MYWSVLEHFWESQVGFVKTVVRHQCSLCGSVIKFMYKGINQIHNFPIIFYKNELTAIFKIFSDVKGYHVFPDFKGYHVFLGGNLSPHIFKGQRPF